MATQAQINARVAQLQAAARNGSAPATAALATSGYTVGASVAQVATRTRLLYSGMATNAQYAAAVNYLAAGISLVTAAAPPVVTLPAGNTAVAGPIAAGQPTWAQLNAGGVPWASFIGPTINAAVNVSNGSGQDAVYTVTNNGAPLIAMQGPSGGVMYAASGSAQGGAPYSCEYPLQAKMTQAISDVNGYAVLGVPFPTPPDSSWGQFFDAVAIVAVAAGAAALTAGAGAGAAGAASSTASSSADFSAGILDPSVTSLPGTQLISAGSAATSGAATTGASTGAALPSSTAGLTSAQIASLGSAGAGLLGKLLGGAGAQPQGTLQLNPNNQTGLQGFLNSLDGQSTAQSSSSSTMLIILAVLAVLVLSEEG